ncbi:hypothetical protein HK405_013547, partial [Cladochytrium tenue]
MSNLTNCRDGSPGHATVTRQGEQRASKSRPRQGEHDQQQQQPQQNQETDSEQQRQKHQNQHQRQQQKRQRESKQPDYQDQEDDHRKHQQPHQQQQGRSQDGWVAKGRPRLHHGTEPSEASDDNNGGGGGSSSSNGGDPGSGTKFAEDDAGGDSPKGMEAILLDIILGIQTLDQATRDKTLRKYYTEDCVM